MVRRIGSASVALVLLCAMGCTISIQPLWPSKPAPAQVVETGPPGMIPVGPQIPLGKMGPPPPVAANNEALSVLIKQYNEAEDHRKALLEQVQTLKRQISEREEKLRLAGHEMEESTHKFKKTREEFRAWESEMTELRQRVHTLESNHRTVAKIIHSIMTHIDLQEPGKLPSFERPHK
jgi:peptidoglycan hydrolase CwlO-like protein